LPPLRSPKRPRTNAIIAAMDDVQKGKVGGISRGILKNVHADSAGEKKRALVQNIRTAIRTTTSPQQYLPDELKGARYYEWGDNKTEQAAKRYWDDIKGKK
jgi:putative ATPase